MKDSLWLSDSVRDQARYLALYLPWFSIERVRGEGRAPPDEVPFALIERRRGALRIRALDPVATDLGLVPDMMLADARSRVPNLATMPHDAGADVRLLERLMHLCGRFTPSIQADPPQALLLDISGCAHLWGGEGALCAAVRTQINGWRLSVHCALADTPDAARALARFGKEDVRALPVEALDAGAEVQGALRRAGFHIIGDLAVLPSAPLAARFGPVTVRLLDRLLGREDPHITPSRPVAPVAVDMRFADPVARTADVLDSIETLVERAAVLLAGRGDGGRAFVVRLHRSDGHVASLMIETGAPTRDPALVLRLLRERIDSLADPLDPGFGYDSIDLVVPRAERLVEEQADMDSCGGQSRPDIGALLDRLAIRYGRACVLCLSGEDSHQPERAGMVEPLDLSSALCIDRRADPGEPPLRPLLLIDPPQRVEVLAAVPDGPPRRFRWRGTAYQIVRQEGPERIAPAWWRRVRGYDANPGLSRDYYRVEEKEGRRFWLFRHGLYGRESVSPDWYVHGLFA